MRCIYKIENTVTKDLYIGSAVNFKNRRYYHIYDLNNQKHHSPILQNSWNKHGKDAFVFSIIEEVSEKNELVVREQHWIDLLQPRYNISRTAGSPLGVRHTIQSRLNMSKAHKGIRPTPEAIAKRTATVLGSKRSEATILRMRAAATCKIVMQYTLDGTFVKEWESCSAAARSVNGNQGHISSCCRGVYGRKTYKKFIWKYKI